MKKTVLLIFSIIIFASLQACSDDRQDNHRSIEQQNTIPSYVVQPAEIAAEPAPEEEDRALKIGVIGPETGESAFYGLRILQGIKMAAKTFNAHGGINGQAIEVIHYDTKSDPGLTEQAVQQLCANRLVYLCYHPSGQCKPNYLYRRG